LGLFYFNEAFNFGDILNPDMARWLGVKAVKHTPPEECDAVFIGSLLHEFLTEKPFCQRISRPPVKIWGTGFISAPVVEKEKLNRRLDVRAVRGRHTLERLKKITGEKLDKVALGDPGLLVSRFVDTGGVAKKYALGIIPHYMDVGHPSLSKINVKNAVTIDVNQPPADFVRQIAQCENIISSAMHGLIAADALGIPNVRMIVGDKIIGGDYKYDDYYSVFGITSHNRIDLNERGFTDADLPGIVGNYTITRKQVEDVQDALLASFPYKNG